MNILLKNKREIASQVTEALNTDLYEREIGGGYNKTRLMIFSNITRTWFKKKLSVGETGVYN